MDSENLSTGTDTCFLVPDEVGTQDHITPYNGNSINLVYKWYMLPTTWFQTSKIIH